MPEKMLYVPNRDEVPFSNPEEKMVKLFSGNFANTPDRESPSIWSEITYIPIIAHTR